MIGSRRDTMAVVPDPDDASAVFLPVDSLLWTERALLQRLLYQLVAQDLVISAGRLSCCATPTSRSAASSRSSGSTKSAGRRRPRCWPPPTDCARRAPAAHRPRAPATWRPSWATTCVCCANCRTPLIARRTATSRCCGRCAVRRPGGFEARNRNDRGSPRKRPPSPTRWHPRRRARGLVTDRCAPRAPISTAFRGHRLVDTDLVDPPSRRSPSAVFGARIGAGVQLTLCSVPSAWTRRSTRTRGVAALVARVPQLGRSFHARCARAVTLRVLGRGTTRSVAQSAAPQRRFGQARPPGQGASCGADPLAPRCGPHDRTRLVRRASRPGCGFGRSWSGRRGRVSRPRRRSRDPRYGAPRRRTGSQVAARAHCGGGRRAAAAPRRAGDLETSRPPARLGGLSAQTRRHPVLRRPHPSPRRPWCPLASRGVEPVAGGAGKFPCVRWAAPARDPVPAWAGHGGGKVEGISVRLSLQRRSAPHRKTTTDLHMNITVDQRGINPCEAMRENSVPFAQFGPFPGRCVGRRSGPGSIPARA